MVYVAGFIWAEIKQLYQEGLHQYMVKLNSILDNISIIIFKADTWNLLDWVTNCLYVATIVLRVMAFIKVRLIIETRHEPNPNRLEVCVGVDIETH